MSQVRMCDRCGVIFSENADGWQSFLGQTVKRQPGGRKETIMSQLDACPACAVNVDAEPPTPTLTPGRVGVFAELEEGDDDDAPTGKYL